MRKLVIPGALVALSFAFAAAGEDYRLAPSGRNLAAPPQTAALDMFVGEWEVRQQGKGAEAPVVARSHAYYILDGFVLQEDYRGLGPGGKVVFRGTSLRSYDPAKGKIVVRWVMANNSGYTNIVAEMVDGELVSTGSGRDWNGREFIERYRFFDISEKAHSFEMERSFDGGETWQGISNTRSTKISD